MRCAFVPILVAATTFGSTREARADDVLPLLPSEPATPVPATVPPAQNPAEAQPAPTVPPRTPRIVYFDPPAASKATESELPVHENALLVSMWQLFRPLVAIVYERRVLPWLGVGALAGVGSLEIGTSGKRIGFQIGPQVHAYLLGSFRHGMPLSVELLGMSSTGTLSDARAKVTGASINPALTLGYKAEFPNGVTLNIHAGVRWSASRVTVSSSDASVRVSDSEFEPLFRTLIGYSF